MGGSHLPVNVSRSKGIIYFDTSSKGGGKRCNKWCAEITFAGVRLRRRSKDREELNRWVNAVKESLSLVIDKGLQTNSYEEVNRVIKMMKPTLLGL